MLRHLARRFLPQSLKHAQVCFAQEGEDMILRRLFKDRKSGFFVDVGAHHPTRFSNTWLLYRQGWSGLNIDANPGSMEPFRRMRPRDINLEMGIASAPGTITYYGFDEGAFNTFDPDQARRVQEQNGARLVQEVPVEVRPLADVLDQHLPEGRAIDLLTVDVEGLDYDVLSSNDWSRFRPEFVLAEVIRSQPGAVTEDKVMSLMLSKGYEVFARTVNTCFFKRQDG